MGQIDIQDVPTHDPLTVVSFVLFSLLLFWDGVGLVGVCADSHRSPFSKRTTPAFSRTSTICPRQGRRILYPFVFVWIHGCVFGGTTLLSIVREFS